jgi:hypothetical protein
MAQVNSWKSSDDSVCNANEFNVLASITEKSGAEENDAGSMIRQR